MTAVATGDEKRLSAVRTLLEEDLMLKVSTITPLGRAFNNYAWTAAVSLDSKSRSATTTAVKSLQAGTTVIPTDITKVVVRMGNPAANLNESVRSQNEVAAMQLCREACSTYPRKIIPDVYGWRNKNGASDEYGGWIVEEFMPGEQLLPLFADLPAAAQQDLLNEMAIIYKCITSYKLPASIKGFGGLGYDEKGDVVIGPIVFGFGGPWASYDEMYEKTMDKQLTLADASAVFNGWRRNGVRERLDRFRAEGIQKVLAKVTDKTPTLIHGDFGMALLINVINQSDKHDFDPTTNTITGLLDFDFAHIAGPADELFYSFASVYGLMTAIFEDTANAIRLRQFLTGESGLPPPVPVPSLSSSSPTNVDETLVAAEPDEEGQKIDWALVAKWNTALLTAKATRPRDLGGITDLTTLYWFVQEVCSPFMSMPWWLERYNEEERMQKVEKAEKNLVRSLEYWGY